MKSTLVKTFLVLNLLLCAAVLGVSIKTFMDREVVKASTVIHRENIEKIAKNLAWGEQVAWETSGERKAESFQLPNPANMEEMGGFITQLEELSKLADQRVAQLSAQFTELTATQAELETTKATLADRVSDLASTRSRVTNLENDLSNTNSQVRETNASVASLERENSSLQQQVESLDTQITNQQTLISRVEADLKRRTGERDRIRELLTACRRPKVTPGGPNPWHQQTAQILAVETEWNYVVINKGEVDTLPMYLEAFVHRGDQFVGKVRVMQVDRTVSLAEVLTETLTEGMTFEAGDTIFF